MATEEKRKTHKVYMYWSEVGVDEEEETAGIPATTQQRCVLCESVA